MTIDPNRSGASAAFARQLEALYGVAELPRDGGVLHVAAVWIGQPDQPIVLKIGPQTPQSADDAFALSLARARADAVLTTGAILRAEPAMTLDPRVDAEACRAWRREAMGRSAPPLALVLTDSGRIPLDHPVMAAHRTHIVTRCPAPIAEAPVPVIELPQPSAAAAIAWARASLGARTVSVEAGPTAARPLYDPMVVDELLLSVLTVPPPPEVLGGAFVPFSRLEAAGLRRVSDTPAGTWRIQRWLRTGESG